MSERTELTERDRRLLEDIEEIVANGGGEWREADSLYGFCAHLASIVPQASDAFRQQLEAHLVARMQRQEDREEETRTPSWLQRLALGVGRINQIFEGGLTMKKGLEVGMTKEQQVTQTQRRPSRWARLVLTTRLGWVLVLAFLLVFGGTSWAVGRRLFTVGQVGRLFQVDVAMDHVEQAGLVQELNLSQTVDGVTVTLEQGYADANRVVVGLTVTGPASQRYSPLRVELIDSAGVVFPRVMGMGLSSKSELLQVELPPGTSYHVYSFDASAGEGDPAELDLRLAIEVEEFEPAPTPDNPPAEPPDSKVVTVLLEPLPAPTIVGLFTFDFGLPFIPGRTVEVQQTVEAAGVAVRLERVVVTPSETQAILCVELPDGGSKEWIPIATLDVGDGQHLFGESRRFDGSVTNESEEESCYRYSVWAPLDDQSGEWTLTVSELVGFDLVVEQPGEEQPRLAGPWEFHFQVP